MRLPLNLFRFVRDLIHRLWPASAPQPAHRPVMFEGVESRQMLSAITASISDSRVIEGNYGEHYAVFEIALSGASSYPISVHYSTANGTALAGQDYQPIIDKSITFVSMQTVAQILIPVIPDTLVEDNETFKVNLISSYGVSILRPTGTAIILDDDRPTVTVAPRDAKASEAGSDPGIFRFYRTGSTAAPLKVIYSIGGTATNGTDYTKIAASVTIPIGRAFADVPIRPVADSILEPAETVVLSIRTSTSYFTGSTKSATVSIANRETTPPTARIIWAPKTPTNGQYYEFAIRYSDETRMNPATIGAGDLHISGPNGYEQDVELVSINPSSDGLRVTANYRIFAPGGQWDTLDNGQYRVIVVANQVKDASGNALPAGAMGTLNIAV